MTKANKTVLIIFAHAYIRIDQTPPLRYTTKLATGGCIMPMHVLAMAVASGTAVAAVCKSVNYQAKNTTNCPLNTSLKPKMTENDN